jgi:hypothetical protein
VPDARDAPVTLMAATTRIDPHFRRVLRMAADCERPGDPRAVVTASRTGIYDGQAWINYRTANALAKRGLLVVDGDTCRLTSAGHAIAQPAERRDRPLLCPACRAMMYPQRALKGYPKDGPDAERRTCALHGPLGNFRHIATDEVDDDA